MRRTQWIGRGLVFFVWFIGYALLSLLFFYVDSVKPLSFCDPIVVTVVGTFSLIMMFLCFMLSTLCFACVEEEG